MLNWLRQKLKTGSNGERTKSGQTPAWRDEKKNNKKNRTVKNKKNNLSEMHDSLQDKTEISETESLIKEYTGRIERKNTVLSIVLSISAAMIDGNEEKINRTLNKSLECIGEYTKADRVQLWQNEMIGGNLHFTRTHEWLSKQGALNAVAIPSSSYAYDEVPGWENKLNRGKQINCPITDLLPHEHEFFDRQKTKALAVIPLFVSSDFKGFIRVDDCTVSRIFTEDMLEDIKSVGQSLIFATMLSDSLGAVNIKRRQADELAHWYGSILDAIPIPISVTDADMYWTFVNTAVESLIGRKRESIYGKHCSTMGTEICNTHDCGIACAKRYVDRTFFNSAGKSYQVDVSKLTNLSGELVGYVEVMQDVTMLWIQRDLAIQNGEHAENVKSEFLHGKSKRKKAYDEQQPHPDD